MDLNFLKIEYKEVVNRVERCLSARGDVGVAFTLVVVSKRRSADEVAALYQLGHRDFGENYVQELGKKAAQTRALGCIDIRWHFIGALQRNKVKNLLATPGLASIQSVDSLKLAKEVDLRAAEAGRPEPLPIYLQVNLDQESTKSGVEPRDALSVANDIRPLGSLTLLGLMAIPDPELDDISGRFAELARIEKSCRPATRGHLSMGMSADFEEAIRQGATCIRVGSLIFGGRHLLV